MPLACCMLLHAISLLYALSLPRTPYRLVVEAALPTGGGAARGLARVRVTLTTLTLTLTLNPDPNQAQRAAGPVRSVVSKPLVLTVVPTTPRAEVETETGAEAGAEPKPELESAWQEPKGAARPDLRVVAKRTAAMLKERMVQMSSE